MESEVRAHLNEIAKVQGWDEQAKLNLCLRFIDRLDTPLSWEAGVDMADEFKRWLEIQAGWENSEGLDAGRP
jgi:hypothetical protein